MAWKCFKKLSPTNSPVLANGSTVKFDTLDHVIGYFATENPYVQGELTRLIGEGRYGMTEIPESEFHSEYVDKKKAGQQPSRPPWREEIGKAITGNSPLLSPDAAKIAAAVAIDESKPVATTTPATPPKTEGFTPRTGRRVPRPAPPKP